MRQKQRQRAGRSGRDAERKSAVRPAGGGIAVAPVQLRDGARHPFGMLDSYVPLQKAEYRLYRGIREAVPALDAAMLKLVRLTGGVQARCGNRSAERALNEWLRHVPAGWGQEGIQSFLDQYLDSMLTAGYGVGEILPSRDGREIAALLTGNPAAVELREGDSPLSVTICGQDEQGRWVDLPRQDLLLFTPLNPEPESPWGVSLLRSMPFLTDILMKIYTAVGQNWDRVGNLRFAVTCRPGSAEADLYSAQERSDAIAQAWSEAMQDCGPGRIRDFVAVGDVDIRVIGADSQILDAEVPVRLILEQLIARTGIPPFLLGLSWSTTERMSTQQADMLTSELYALRRTLEPVLRRICGLWLRLHGFDGRVEFLWDEINLQDQVDDAKAALYIQQARALQLENDRNEAAAGGARTAAIDDLLEAKV